MKLPELIQMISALSEARWRTEQGDLERQRLAQSGRQFSQQFQLSSQQHGLMASQEHRVGLEEFLKRIDDGTPKTRDQIIAMGHSYGVTDEDIQHATQYAADSPMTTTTLGNVGATAGYNAAPAAEKADWEHEAGVRALTGVGADALAQGHLIGAIVEGAHRQLNEMSPKEAAPYYQGQLAGMTHPLEGAVQHAIMSNPKTLGNYVAIQAGQQGTWAQIESLKFQQDLMKFNTTKALGPPTAYQRSIMLSRIGQQIRIMRDPKTSRDARWQMARLVNQAGRDLGIGDLVQDPDHMEGAGVWEQFENSFIPPDAGTYMPQAAPIDPNQNNEP